MKVDIYSVGTGRIMAGGRTSSNILFSGQKTENCGKRFCTALEMFKQNNLAHRHCNAIVGERSTKHAVH